LRKLYPSIATVALLGLATACTSGQAGVQPAYTSTNLSNDRLTAAAGIATFNDGTVGLNIVAAWRQPNGDSATGLSTPSITGPATFIVPNSAQAGQDAGTNIISGSLQVPPGQTAKASTFSTSNGIFSYGIQPDNSDSSGDLISSFNTLPFYAADTDPNCFPSAQTDCPQDQFIGGPPAFPNFRNGDYPAAFNGYSEGFTTFYATPVTGTYGVKVTIQTSNTGTFVSPVASATLTKTTPLPPWTVAPVITPSGSGGATVTFTPPAGVTETIVNIQDTSSGGIFTAIATAGQKSVIFPDNIGPGNPPTTTFATGDALLVQLAGVDYPAFEAAPPNNKSISPTLAGANGQTDVTFADYSYTFGGSQPARAHQSKFIGRLQRASRR